MVVFSDVVVGVVPSAVLTPSLQNVQHLCAKVLQSRRRGEERDRKSFFIGHSIFSADTSITHIKIDAINLPPLVVRQNLKRFLYLHMVRRFPVQNLRHKDSVQQQGLSQSWFTVDLSSDLLCYRTLCAWFLLSGVGLTSPGTAATSGLLYSPRW
jgi:hypothetical protein